jgi:hypothetical protein
LTVIWLFPVSRGAGGSVGGADGPLEVFGECVDVFRGLFVEDCLELFE